MTGVREGFERSDQVHGVKARVHSEEDLDNICHALSIFRNDCTHCSGCFDVIVDW